MPVVGAPEGSDGGGLDLRDAEHLVELGQGKLVQGQAENALGVL